MFALSKRLLLVLALLLTAAASGAAPTAEEIAKAIRELGANRFAAREKATAFLRAAGRAAEPALREAAKSKDVEVARRAKEILEEFKWGIYPDTPKEVLQQVRDYRGGDQAVKQRAMERLANLGTPGYVTLLKMSSAEEDAAARTALVQFLARESTRAIPVLLVDSQEETAEQFAEIAQEVLKETNVRHYAAFLLQRKRLDAKIAHYRVQAAKPKGTDAAWVLSYLYRAKGDLPAARQAAEKANDKALALMILAEEGNWQELAKRTGDPKPDIEALGYRAAYQRLTGQAAEFEKTVAALRKVADAEPEQSPASRQVAKALFLNDRPAEALAVLIAKKHDLPAFDVLGAQLNYRQALELAAKAKGDEETPRRTIEFRLANMLYVQLGEKEKGLEALTRGTELVKQDGSAKAFGDLIRAEQRLGRTEPAFEACVAALAKSPKSEHTAPAVQMLESCFPEHGDSAYVWWTFLRKKYASEKEAATMRRLRELFAGKVAGKKLTASARDLEEETLGENVKAADLAGYYLAVAEVCEAAKANDEARASLKKYAKVLGTPAAWQRLGDFLMKDRDFPEAAAGYDKAYRKDVRQPLPLFLRGQALVQTGKKDEGRKLMELAHRIPLADEDTRYNFAGALADRGFAADSRREYELILRIGPGEGWHSNETIRHLAYEAMGRKDYRQAAELFERFRLRCLRANTSFVEYSAYVHVPAAVHQNRARAALQAGKLDEAKRAVEQCLAALPGGVQLPIELVAAFDKAGRTKDGDEIFHRVFDLYEKRAAEYPNGASLHNSAAWAAAACRRELEKALTHAEKAVELAPGEAGYLDTLAEVCFQRGDKARALKLIKRCMELEPSNDYFPRQLQRIEKGDPKAPLPDGA